MFRSILIIVMGLLIISKANIKKRRIIKHLSVCTHNVCRHYKIRRSGAGLFRNMQDVVPQYAGCSFLRFYSSSYQEDIKILFL